MDTTAWIVIGGLAIFAIAGSRRAAAQAPTPPPTSPAPPTPPAGPSEEERWADRVGDWVDTAATTALGIARLAEGSDDDD